MIVVRFKVKCKHQMVEKAKAAFKAVVAPSRTVEGVISFDIAQDLTDPSSLIATEVFKDRVALERQESLPEVKNVINLLPEFLAADPEATIYNISSSEPWGG